MATDQTKGQAPLAGMIMCCTSILPDQRQDIAMQVAAMGAEHKYDLTSDVTHLIVGSVTTAKYQYVAKERPDVKAVLPTFIQAVRDCWLTGEEPDVTALEAEHRAPPLYGLRICLTGFEELKIRESLSESIRANGGKYECDLIKGIVNVLIAKNPGGRKYDHARKWDIPVVSLKWVTNSLERGMALDTVPFDPVIPVADQGEGAVKQAIPEMVSLGKRQREDASASTLAGPGKRKLRRTMSSKLESQQENIWADIADAASAKSASEPHQGAKGHGNGAEQQERTDVDSGVAPAEGDATLNDEQRNLKDVNISTTNYRAKPIGMFNGVNICIHGFDGKKLAIIQEHLLSRGADLVDISQLDPEKLQGQSFLIVPHDVPKFMLPPIPDAAAKATQVTEWWVESCMHKKKVVDPEDDYLSKPFSKLSIDGLKGLVVCSTGFKDSDLLHLSKVVRLMGGTYDEFLKQSTSLLVCKSKSTNVEKLRYAGDHSIPAVSEDWLWESIEIGAVQPFDSYTLQPIALRHSNGNNKTGPFQEDDEPTAFPTPQLPSQSRKSQPSSKANIPRPTPLRELSAENLNVPTPSPEKDGSESPGPAKDGEGPESIKSLGGSAPIEPQQESNSTSLSAPSSLKDSITALLAHKEEASARRASNPLNPDNTGIRNLSRRKRGLLGRATSNASSVNDEPLPVATQVEGRVGLPPPTQSQKIGWRENGEESIGMVRDAVGDGGGGGARAAGRRRKAALA